MLPMKYRSLYILVFSAALFIAQSGYTQSEVTLNTKHDYEMGFQVDVATSSTLNNAMLFADGFIEDNLKSENLDRLNYLNQGGSYSDMKLFFRQDRKELWGVKNLGLYFGVEWHYIDEYRFTDDLYKLVFYGNKSFAGKEANLTHSGRQLVNYYQIKGGLQKKSQNLKHRYGGNIAFNMGNKLNTFNFNDPSHLYTHPNGTMLSLQMNANYSQSDTAQDGWFQVSGIGASIDLFYEFSKKDQFSILFSVENLGFIHWNKNTIYYSENNVLNFSGIEVDNLFDMPNPLIQSSDTLMDYVYSKSERKSQSLYTPTDIKLYYQHYFLSKKIQTSVLVSYRLFSYALPLYQVDATYQINSKLKLGPIVAYGGYTAFNAGLKLELILAKDYFIRLESRYITGFAQHSFSGIGGFINFTYKI